MMTLCFYVGIFVILGRVLILIGCKLILCILSVLFCILSKLFLFGFTLTLWSMLIHPFSGRDNFRKWMDKMMHKISSTLENKYKDILSFTFEWFWCLIKLVANTNIANGTTDPRVEFISQVQTQIWIKFYLQNLDQASTSKSQPNISLSIKL